MSFANVYFARVTVVLCSERQSNIPDESKRRHTEPRIIATLSFFDW